LAEEGTDAGTDTPAHQLTEHEVSWRLVETWITAAGPDLDGALSREVDTLGELEHGQRPATDLLLNQVVLSNLLWLKQNNRRYPTSPPLPCCPQSGAVLGKNKVVGNLVRAPPLSNFRAPPF